MVKVSRVTVVGYESHTGQVIAAIKHAKAVGLDYVTAARGLTYWYVATCKDSGKRINTTEPRRCFQQAKESKINTAGKAELILVDNFGRKYSLENVTITMYLTEGMSGKAFDSCQII